MHKWLIGIMALLMGTMILAIVAAVKEGGTYQPSFMETDISEDFQGEEWVIDELFPEESQDIADIFVDIAPDLFTPDNSNPEKRIEEETAEEEAYIYLRRIPLIYFDPTKDRLVSTTPITAMSGNYFYDEYTVEFQEVSWKRRRLPVKNSTLVQEIRLDGHNVTLVCRRGIFAEQSEDDNGAYLQLTDPKALYDAVVVIDPGHGGYDHGAVVNQVSEKDLNLDIALRLIEIFKDERLLLLPTRRDDTYVSLEDRYQLSNRIGDYFIAIHNNVDERSANTSGTITYYPTIKNETAAASEYLARSVQTELINKLGSRDRGILPDNEYRVLKNAKIPAILVEVMFMTNEAEAAQLNDPACRTLIAQALRDAIYTLPESSISVE